MAISKTEFKQAFEDVIALEFAEISMEESAIEYTFSDNFLNRMTTLVSSQKKKSWNLIHYVKRHVAIIAIVLFGAFITACGVAQVIRMDSKLQENAIAAHNLIVEAMGFDEIGNIKFPDTYAGSWIEGEKLVISLTETSDAVTKEYIEWVGEYADVLQFEKAEYSYNYLYAKMEEIVEDIKNNHGVEVLECGVSEMDNEIHIVVDSKDYAKVKKTKYEVPVVFEKRK